MRRCFFVAYVSTLLKKGMKKSSRKIFSETFHDLHT